MKDILPIWLAFFLTTTVYGQWSHVNRVDVLAKKIAMFDEETGFIASWDYLYRTDDGWRTYTKIMENVRVLDFAFDKKGRIVCIGLDRLTNKMGYQVSIDAGLTWRRYTGTTNSGYFRVSCIADSVFIIGAAMGYVSISHDKDLLNWETRKVDDSLSPVFRQIFNEDGIGIMWAEDAFTDKFKLYKTTNFGYDWNFMEGSDTLGIKTQHFCSHPNGFIGAGQDGQIAFYNRNANIERNIWSGIYQSFSDVVAPGGDTLYACTWFYTLEGRFGTVYRSYDMGRSFEHISPVGNLESIASMSFVSTQTGYLITGYGHVYKTTNGGGDPYPDSLNVPVVVPVDTQKITAIAETRTDESRLRIFPNPAGQTLTAAWDFETPAGGTLLLYNMQGQALMSWPMPQGGKAVLSVADLPLGMYLLRYTTPEKNGAARFVKGG
jgi:hypothetical protein